jgi:predicted ATPase
MSTTSSLSTLETNGLIRLYQREPELEYLFSHALVQDTAYDSLLKSDKRNIHLLTGKILETLHPERLDEIAPELARHFEEAGENALAADYYARAGQRALNTFANIEAADYFRAAIHLHPEKQSRTFIDLHLNLGTALFTLGRQAESVEVYLAGAQICQKIGDIENSMQCYLLAARSYFYAGDFQNQYQIAREGYEIARDHTETANMVLLLSTMANASYFNGLPEDAIQYAQRSMDMAQRVGNDHAHGYALVAYGTVMPYNQSAKKLNALREAADFASAHDLPSFHAAVFNYAETLFNVNGGWRTACEFFQNAIARAKQTNAALAEFWHISGLQKALTITGQFEQADKLNERINELIEIIPDHGTLEGALIIIKAVRSYYNGDNAQAISVLEKGFSAAIKNNDQQLINEMGVWLAEISIAEGKYDVAAELLPKAIAAGDRNLIWGGVIPRCLLAAVQARSGQIKLARQTLDEARISSLPDPGSMAQYALALATARVASAEKRWKDASAFYEQACTLAKQMELTWQYNHTVEEWDKIKGNL